MRMQIFRVKNPSYKILKTKTVFHVRRNSTVMIYSAINCFSIHMYEYRDFYTKKNTFVYMIKCY